MSQFARLARRSGPLSVLFGGGLAAKQALTYSPWRRPIYCDGPKLTPDALNQYERTAKTPVTRDGRVNPQIFSQLSKGSILGLLGGVAVSVFSKPLAFFIGLTILGLQALESRGIHIVPYKRIQRYFTNIDVQSSLQDNVALKLSFGLTFTLAAFGSF